MTNNSHPIKQFLDPIVSLVIKRQAWRKIVFVFSIAAISYVLAANFSSLRQSYKALREGNLLLLGLAAVAVTVTYLTAAGVYWALSDRKLVYRQMLQVEAAGAFTSRLLPAGIGGIATNLKYISKVLHSKTAASAIIAFNNILSFLSYLMAGFIMILVTHQPLRSAIKIALPQIPLWPVVIFFVVMGGLVLMRTVRAKIKASWHKLKILLQGYREHPHQIIIGLLCALGTTVFYLLAFYLCCQALGTHLTLLQAFIAFTLGLTGGTIAPTPGGLGGAELGFYTGLYSTGLNSADALSIVLVYRLISFWLPIIPGFLFFHRLLRKNIL